MNKEISLIIRPGTMDERKIYYKDNSFSIIHREDGPAIERITGTKEWWINGKLHRDDGPAIEWSDGDRWWYKNGLRHREDGPAIEGNYNHKEYYLNGINYSETKYYGMIRFGGFV